MVLVADCEREITDLHEFFVQWYSGHIENEEFERLEQALHPSFVMVTPDGSIQEKSAVCDGIRANYNQYGAGEFEIEIRNIRPIFVDVDRALVQYEEWQESPAESTGRRSSVLFESPDTPESSVETDHTYARPVPWRYLHESWIDPPVK